MITLINAQSSTLTLPLTMGWTRVPFEKRVPVERLVGNGGVISGRQTIEPRRFQLTGSIFMLGSNTTHSQVKQANIDWFDALQYFLKFTPIEVQRNDGRRILAYPTSVDQNWVDDDEELELTISMIAPEPFFYGPVESEDEVGIGQTDVPHDFTLTTGGSHRSYPVITMVMKSGTMIDPSFECGAYKIELDGSFDFDVYDPDTIVIDAKCMRVLVNGISAINTAGDDFLVKGFPLLIGDNVITFNATGTFEVDINFTWYPLWL